LHCSYFKQANSIEGHRSVVVDPSDMCGRWAVGFGVWRKMEEKNKFVFVYISHCHGLPQHHLCSATHSIDSTTEFLFIFLSPTSVVNIMPPVFFVILTLFQLLASTSNTISLTFKMELT
jgi:hypothetical protein